MLSEVRYGSLLVYSPRGQGAISRQSQRACYNIKSAQPATLDRVRQVLTEQAAQGRPLAGLFNEATLVPMPRSSPLLAGALWPAERICQTIIQAGLGARVVPALKRQTAVPKSSTSAPGERPSASTHYQSFSAAKLLDVGDNIVVVDDVVTKGTTAIAAISRLAEAYPDAQISLFAVVRTKGLVPDIDRIIEPVIGIITLDGDEGDRQP